jgi:ferritin-like metal-binding protein YciE
MGNSRAAHGGAYLARLACHERLCSEIGVCLCRALTLSKECLMAQVKTLSDLFIHLLRRAYDGEQRLTKGLSALNKAAASPELKHAFTAHLEETEAHVERLEQVFGIFNEKSTADTFQSIKGVVKDAEDAIGLQAEGALRDAALIAAAQEAEHIEIAAYGTLRTWAVLLKKLEAVHILEWTLEEEKSADRKLTEIAEKLNVQAATTPAR